MIRTYSHLFHVSQTFCCIFSYCWSFFFNISTLALRASGKPKAKKDKNFPDCTILDSWAFENFALADKPFAKPVLSLKTCVLVNNNLCRKLVSSLELPSIYQ